MAGLLASFAGFLQVFFSCPSKSMRVMLRITPALAPQSPKLHKTRSKSTLVVLSFYSINVPAHIYCTALYFYVVISIC